MHLLSDGEGRCREIDNGVGASSHQFLHRVGMVAPALPEIAVVPDILADGDAKDGALEAQDLGF